MPRLDEHVNRLIERQNPPGITAVEVADRLRSALARAEATWPNCGAHADVFLGRVSESLIEGAPLLDSLDQLFAPDLLLACAAVSGQPQAIRDFDAVFLEPVPRYVHHIRASPSFADEVRQLVRTRLLVAEAGRRPRLAEYAGRGPLVAFVKICAVRAALDLVRAPGDVAHVREATDDALVGSEAGIDPELDYIRARYREPFEEAFRDALAARSPEERTLLRLSYFDGVTLHELAVLHHVHLSTMSRRIAAIREAVREGTRLALAARLGANPDDLSSLVRLLDSQLDVSLRMFLSDYGRVEKK